MASIKTGSIINIESTKQFEQYRDTCGDMLLVIDFYAEWCGPCKAISPAFKELAKENTDVCFIQVDVDEQDEIAAMCNVECMPTFFFYKNGKEVKNFSGANKKTLKEAVAHYKKQGVK